MYAVSLDAAARQQAETLPVETISSFPELRALLEAAPWSGESLNPDHPKANMLTQAFGGRGLVTYLVLDEPRVVYIVRVDWLG